MNDTNTSSDSAEPVEKAYKLASFLWAAALAATITAVAAVLIFFPARAESGETTQSFRAGRFALETAEINVAMQQPSGGHTQKMLFKVDTLTGEVWALQMSVRSRMNPRILSAEWVKVQPLAASFQNNLFQQF